VLIIHYRVSFESSDLYIEGTHNLGPISIIKRFIYRNRKSFTKKWTILLDLNVLSHTQVTQVCSIN